MGAPATIPGAGSSWGPALCEFNGRLYAAWKGSGADKQLWYSSFDGSSWAPQATIPGAASEIGPALAGFGNKLYAAWRGSDTDEQLYYSSFDGSSWAPQATIPDAASAIGRRWPDSATSCTPPGRAAAPTSSCGIRRSTGRTGRRRRPSPMLPAKSGRRCG